MTTSEEARCAIIVTLEHDDDAEEPLSELASSLRDYATDELQALDVQVSRTNTKSQMMFDTVSIIVGSQAVATLAAGLAAWLRTRRAKITARLEKDGARTVIVENVTSADAAQIVKDTFATDRR